MKIVSVLLLSICAGAWGDPLTLVNVLPDRPVFNLVADGFTQSRTLAPGNRISLPPGTFSGVGLKAVPMAGGQTYYLARFGALAGLYVLPPDQVLILNQSGQPIDLTVDGVSATVASGGFALGTSAQPVTWEGQTAPVQGGHVYRLLLTSPEGLGTTIGLNVWK